jgi:hypothetical protein
MIFTPKRGGTATHNFIQTHTSNPHKLPLKTQKTKRKKKKTTLRPFFFHKQPLSSPIPPFTIQTPYPKPNYHLSISTITIHPP